MKYAWFVAAIMSARLIITAVGYPPGDGDLAWQRWLGRTILATHHIPRALGVESFSAIGAPWTPQEWLFSIAAALGTGSVGWPLFAIGVSLCPIATLLVVAYRCVRRGAAPIDVAIVTSAMGTALFDSFGVRAQVVAWPMVALMLLVLDIEGPWLWAAVPVAALWSNLHASAAISPLLVGIVTVSRLLEDRAWTPRVGRAAAVMVAVGVAVCCNPFGIGLVRYAVSLFTSPIKMYISEWDATDIGEYSFSLGSLPLLLGSVAAGIAARRRTGDALTFALFTMLLFLAARNVPLFAIASAPLLARSLTETFARSAPSPQAARIDRLAGFVLPVFVLLVTVFVSFSLLHNVRRAEITMPLKEVAALTQMPGEHRILCADFAWCSYFLGIPNQRVFLDGRADPYPPRVWKEYAAVTYLLPHWREALTTHGVNAVIVKRGSPIDQALALTHQWCANVADAKFRLWMLGACHQSAPRTD